MYNIEMKSTTKRHTFVKDCAGVILLLPSLGATFMYQSTALQIIPLMLGSLVYLLMIGQGRTRFAAVGLGILVLLGIYVVYNLLPTNCGSPPDYSCAEGKSLAFLLSILLFIVNASVIVGLSYWIKRFDKRAQQS